MSVTNGANIIVVYNPENREKAGDFVSQFNERFPYMRDLNLLFTPEYDYREYQQDLADINEHTELAEIADERDLAGYSGKVRLLLNDGFFEVDVDQQCEVVLHELGHYFTNPDLIEMRQFIAVENPKKIGLPDPKFSNLTQAHNTALYYIFQIPKLMQEVKANRWVIENEPQYAESWLRRYCEGLQSPDEIRSTTVNRTFLYEIPKLNFLILWRKAIIPYTNFSYSEDCVRLCDEVNEAILHLAKKAGLKDLQVLKLQDQVLNCLVEEDVQGLIKAYKQVFRDYIYRSARFFPVTLRADIRKFYGLS